MWNVRTMMKTGKMENRKIEMKRLDIGRVGRYNILGLREIRCPDNGDFWSDNIRVIHTNSRYKKIPTKLVLEWLSIKNGVCELQMSNVVTYSSRLCLAKMESTSSNLRIIGR